MLVEKDLKEIINKIQDVKNRIGVAYTREYIIEELEKIINRGNFLLKNNY